jgi:hypothetical protein
VRLAVERGCCFNRFARFAGIEVVRFACH